MQVQTQEVRIIIAIEAIQISRRKLSRRKAAEIYEIPEPTLRTQINGRPSRSNIRANSHKLIELEERVIINYILDRDSRGFSPR
jgi:hypothetical protein